MTRHLWCFNPSKVGHSPDVTPTSYSVLSLNTGQCSLLTDCLVCQSFNNVMMWAGNIQEKQLRFIVLAVHTHSLLTLTLARMYVSSTVNQFFVMLPGVHIFCRSHSINVWPVSKDLSNLLNRGKSFTFTSRKPSPYDITT